MSHISVAVFCVINMTGSTRLVGLAALTGAVTSEGLYSSTTFRHQVSHIVSALLFNIQDVDLSVLENEFSPPSSLSCV